MREDLRKYTSQSDSKMPNEDNQNLSRKGLESFKTKVPLILSTETPRPFREKEPSLEIPGSNRISRTEFDTLYDIDETKFSTFKSVYTSKDKSLNSSNNFSKKHANFLLKRPDDGPGEKRRNSSNQSLNSRDTNLLSYDGIINLAFADVSFANVRKTSPVQIEEAQQLPRVVRRFEPPEDDTFLSSKTYSISPEHSIRVANSDKQRLSARNIDFKGAKEQDRTNKTMMLSYGHETDTGLPAKWLVAKEMHTVDWDAMRHDSIAERSYPHAHLIEPVLNDSQSQDVRKGFRNESGRRKSDPKPSLNRKNSALIASFEDPRYDSGADKVGAEVPFSNPFISKGKYSSPYASFKKLNDPVNHGVSPSNTIRAKSVDVGKNPEQRISNQMQKKSIVEQLINDLDADEKLSNISRIDVSYSIPDRMGNFINTVDVVDATDGDMVDGFPLPPQIDDRGFKANVDFEESHNNSFRENPLFDQNDELDDKLSETSQGLPPPPPPPPPLQSPLLKIPHSNVNVETRQNSKPNGGNIFSSILTEIKGFTPGNLKPIQRRGSDELKRIKPVSPPINFKNDNDNTSVGKVSNNSKTSKASRGAQKK